MTPKRINNRLWHPNLKKIEASTRSKGGNHLGYTSDRSTPETSKDVFALSRIQNWPFWSESDYMAINTATTTTTPTVTTLSDSVNTVKLLDTSRIDISPILPVNVSTTTIIPMTTITTASSSSSASKSLWVLSNKIWKRVQVATHVDKEAIAKLGVAFGLTYNLISNINGSISLSLAWYIASVKVRRGSTSISLSLPLSYTQILCYIFIVLFHCFSFLLLLLLFLQTGLSPLAPGQWKTLLAAYGTLYVFLCFIRPFRIALAIGVTGKVENMLQRMQNRFGCHQAAVIGVAILCSVSVWLFFCALGVTVASTLAGVPFWRVSSSLV
jgi:hypothetical protein